MNNDRMKELLKQALPRVSSDESARDLWPNVLLRIAQPAAAKVPWFDWALLAGLIGFAAFVPASIPVFLYYL